MTRIGVPLGDDRLRIRATFPMPTTPAINPLINGIRILVEDSTGGVSLDVMLPGGPYNPTTQRGWLVNGTGLVYTYRDTTDAPINGIEKVSLNASNGNAVRFIAIGRDSTYPAPQRVVSVSVVVNATTGQCGEVVLRSPESCKALNDGSRYVCK